MEILAALTGIVSVYLNTRQNWWGWAWGLVSTALYAWIFYSQGLPYNAALQGGFALLSIYGLSQWRTGQAGQTELPITHTTKAEAWALASAGLLASVLIFGKAFLRMMHWGGGEDSADIVSHLGSLASLYPRLADPLLTLISLAAQYLLARKRLENWLLWIVADVFYIGLFALTGMWLTTCLYAIFLALAIHGWREWQSELKANG